MQFRNVFIAIFIGSSLILAAVLVNRARPRVETSQPSADFVRATGRCASCHVEETGAIVHQFERSVHAQRGVTCLDCHQVLDNQEPLDHRGFTIAAMPTSQNCAACHATQYDQFLRSRHAAPAWAAVRGSVDFSEDVITASELLHPGAVDRPPNSLVLLEGAAASKVGCQGCHDIGRPNTDGSIGKCTECHSAHSASVSLAREPATCGQCHMGPDHSQLEIYYESKHGVLFSAQRASQNLHADPRTLSTKDMSIPTCATCHMSGLDGMGFTHDVTERLSWWLFAAVSEKRPTYQQGQAAMKTLCQKCHTAGRVSAFYEDAEAVVASTNEKVQAAMDLMAELADEGLLTDEPFDTRIDFLFFDFWHYAGRTAKHGAFMGGPDFVQWHGNYELLAKMVEMEELAAQMRARR